MLTGIHSILNLIMLSLALKAKTGVSITYLHVNVVVNIPIIAGHSGLNRNSSSTLIGVLG
jgi:hypothetical protein